MTHSLDPRDACHRRRSAISRTILCRGLGLSLALALIFWLARDGRPGDPLRQIAATIGSACLLVPLVFSILKRGAWLVDSPRIFEYHVFFSLLGLPLIMLHAAAGDWLSPAALVLALTMALLIQGVVLRGWVSALYSRLFAREPTVMVAGFDTDRKAIAGIISAKTSLLRLIDSAANEAVFSPQLRHWLHSPLRSLRYKRLAYQEARLTGIQRRAGWLAWARSIHLVLAGLFYLGLLAHIIVVLFFAGYVAGTGDGDGTVYWWHVTAWGKP